MDFVAVISRDTLPCSPCTCATSDATSLYADTYQHLDVMYQDLHDKLKDQVAGPLATYVALFPEIKVRFHSGVTEATRS